VTGALSVPIASLDTDNKERDCHLQEAMGINYEKSDFPKNHVCRKDDTLPTEGPNSVVYPHIKFEITKMKSPTVAEGFWEMHGVRKPIEVQVQATIDKESVRVKGKHEFRLSDFGIQVKPAKIVFVTISVRDPATVEFDLLFETDSMK
jgi:polyisoprenoid-binding protein YceI